MNASPTTRYRLAGATLVALALSLGTALPSAFGQADDPRFLGPPLVDPGHGGGGGDDPRAQEGDEGPNRPARPQFNADQIRPPHGEAAAAGLRPDLPASIVSLRTEIEAERTALHNALRTALNRLEDNAPREDRASAIEAFNTANADRIAAHRARLAQLREDIRIFREGQLTEDARSLKAQIRVKFSELQDARSDLRDSLVAATDEEREALIESFRADQRDRIDELKQLKKQLREEVRGGREDGDRRGDG